MENSTAPRRPHFAGVVTVGALTIAALVLTAGGAKAVDARDAAIQSAIIAQTGSGAAKASEARSLADSGVSIDVGRDGRTQAALETFAQVDGDMTRMISVIESDSTEGVDFRLGLPKGAKVTLAGGRAAIVRSRGDAEVEVLATIERPWAIDAAGRHLPTSYTYADGVLTQHIDTSAASFPVVLDPAVTTGFYIVPVFYVQYTWTETWWVKNHIPQSAVALALLCSRTGEAAPFCAYYGALFLNDVRVTTDAAIAHSTCLKMRLPAVLGAIGIPAYDSYYVTCKS
ncbi:hypothetical protein [Phycicoccus sp. Soil802]|uniref:hypothetical protein n=1 Tax=Phycicoccus sp. Soil802 TaxID=1736414 RepID=UPI000ABF8F3B|nr:hypothetical protein [Phycicoccus sp. Soil802]